MAIPLTQHQEPRISVNDLALYMVSSETARLGIIKRSKYPTKPPIIRYRDVRPIVISYLADSKRNVQPLVSAEVMFSQRADDPSGSSLRQDDARQSIEEPAWRHFVQWRAAKARTLNDLRCKRLLVY
jgi:hypothetical protein